MANDEKAKDRELQEEMNSLAGIGPAGRSKRAARSAPKVDVEEAASTPNATPTTSTSRSEAPAKPIDTKQAPAGKPKKLHATTSPQATKPAKPETNRSYRVRIPVELDAEIDKMIAARNVTLSYAVRLAYARNHEQVTASVPSDEAQLLAAAGMSAPASQPQGETNTRSYYMAPSSRLVMKERAKALNVSVAELLREVLRIEVELWQAEANTP